MMKLTLNTYQRAMLIAMLSQFSGKAGPFRKAYKLLDLLEFTPEEKEQISFQEVRPGQFSWAPDHVDDEWQIEVADRELAAFLKRQASNFEGWQMARADDVLGLLDQLEIDDE